METYQVLFVDLREGKCYDMQLGENSLATLKKSKHVQILGEPKKAGFIK